MKLNYITIKEAKLIRSVLAGKAIPSENRVLVFTPDSDQVLESGIIIPGSVKEGKPRKGVIILSGIMDDDHINYRELTQTGMIITYGLYAGKEVEFDSTLFPINLQDIVNKGKFTILDTNEIIMAETNV